MTAAWIPTIFMSGVLLGLIIGIVRGGQVARADTRADFEQIAAEWDQLVADREEMQRTFRAMAEEIAVSGPAAATEQSEGTS